MAQHHVINSYVRQYADPISFAQGEAIVRERKDPDENFPGWWCTDKRGKSGWLLATKADGEQGWVPLDHVLAL